MFFTFFANTAGFESKFLNRFAILLISKTSPPDLVTLILPA